MEIEKLNLILKYHKKWLAGEDGGIRANLSGADLIRADLSGANLSGADLSDANLIRANLSGANLSGCKGLINSADWMIANFVRDDHGVIVYKAIGNTTFAMPEGWVIEPGAFLTEVCNPIRTLDCACGVNFGTLEWIKKNYMESKIWRCRIHWIDLVGVTVPYNTDGKARCERLELLEEIHE